jgi:branched-chain amino acid transport system substrate-binding protein
MTKSEAYMRIRLATLALTTTLLAGTAVAAFPSGTAAASGSPYKIALITSLTGPGSSEFSQAAAGFDARIALQNAKGGIDGHKLEGMVLDDQTSPSEVVTAVQNALSKDVIGVVSASPLFFLAAKYPNEQGVPVTGGFFDGPEWGEHPYTNMFASDVGSVNPKYPVNT